MAEKKKAGFWGLTKELAKEAQKIVGNTIEGVKSASENIKLDAHKHHLEHIEKMKKLEKRAKDAGISDEDLTKLKKDLGVTDEDLGKSKKDLTPENQRSTPFCSGWQKLYFMFQVRCQHLRHITHRKNMIR